MGGKGIKQRLSESEEAVRSRGVRLSYEKLQFAGLKLNSGLCWFRGRYYLFVDRYKPPAARLELLGAALEELDELAASGRLENPEAPEDAPQPEPAQDAEPEPEDEPEPALEI
jgi:hypothetical protein